MKACRWRLAAAGLLLLGCGCTAEVGTIDSGAAPDGGKAPSDAGAPADGGSPADGGGTVDAGPTLADAPLLPAGGAAIPTFHSIGLYWSPPSAPLNNAVRIRYGKPGDTAWRRGHDLWYDTRAGFGFQPRPVEARGSIVHCEPASDYLVQFGMPQTDGTTQWVAELKTTTWSESFPSGVTLTPWTGTKTTLTNSSYLGSRSGNSRSQVLLMNQSGTASGYTVYDLKGAVAQAGNQSNQFPVVIQGSYMILRGIKTVGGESGVFIDPGSHHIVIENSELTAYGRSQGVPLASALPGEWAVQEDSGIKFPDASFGPILDTKQIVIQRNKIHNPFAGSNSWDTGHPLGAAPITMYATGGNNVIRYNEAYSTSDGKVDGPADTGHFHEDGLVMGGDNDQGIGPDTDIYQNIVMHYFDDGLETDGDGTNDRVWGNYFDYGGATAVSTTSTNLGPVYVFRNVYNRVRMYVTDPWGNERDRVAAFKSGGITYNGGRRYLYHNTTMQPSFASQGAPGPNTLGAGQGAGGTGGTTNGMKNTVSRNNIFEIWQPTRFSVFDLTNASGNDLDGDLSNAPIAASLEPNGIGGMTPQYQPGNGWASSSGGKYRLQTGTPGHDDALVIPNFNDGAGGQYQYSGAGPDRGAAEDGRPDLTFGTTAGGPG